MKEAAGHKPGGFFCVLGMSIDYRVKVPNSPAGGKS